MNIKGRIYARKILLVYRYEQYFLEIAGEKDVLMEDIEKIQHIIKQQADTEEVILKKVMTKEYYSNMDMEIDYIITNYFHNFKKAVIDYDYIKQIGPTFYQYRDVVRDLVDTHTISFSYEEMDLIDRVIFVLGYAEYIKIKTPKEVIINEMVELAKRYGDDKSSKLVNGIGHKILSSLEENDIPINK